jgi:hypothetical protein
MQKRWVEVLDWMIPRIIINHLTKASTLDIHVPKPERGLPFLILIDCTT